MNNTIKKLKNGDFKVIRRLTGITEVTIKNNRITDVTDKPLEVLENQSKLLRTRLTMLLLLVSFIGLSQTRLTINQDARLAFYGDDKGNNSYTPNLTFRVSQFFISNEYVRPLTLVEYEIADLEGGLYSRIGIGVGVNIPITSFVEGQFQFSSGYINRNGRSYASPEMVGNLSFKITEKISLLLEGQRTIRNDLKGQPVIYSGKIGLRFELFNKPFFED